MQLDGDVLVSVPAVKAVLFSNLFHGNWSLDFADCLDSCYRLIKLDTFAFKSREDCRLLSELDPYCGVDSVG